MKKRAFTLIELLVVIAVIAVLMGVLMPALQRVKEVGREMACRSNLRQYAIAGKIYLTENDEKFPNPQTWLYSTNQIIEPCAWHDASTEADGSLWHYLKDMDVHMCPSFRGLALSRGAEHSQHDPAVPIDPQYSYSMNYYLGSGIAGGARTSSQVKYPSEIIFFSEENCWAIPGLSTYALNNNILYLAEDDSLDCLGTYHKTSSSDLNSGAANIAFVDGSVGTGEAKDGYTLSYPGRR